MKHFAILVLATVALSACRGYDAANPGPIKTRKRFGLEAERGSFDAAAKTFDTNQKAWLISDPYWVFTGGDQTHYAIVAKAQGEAARTLGQSLCEALGLGTLVSFTGETCSKDPCPTFDFIAVDPNLNLLYARKNNPSLNRMIAATILCKAK